MNTGNVNVVTTGTKLSSTSATACYTAPAASVAQVKSIHVANTDSSVRNATVTWFDDSTSTSYTLLHQGKVPINGCIKIPIPEGMQIDPGDEIRVTASSANTLQVIVNVVETVGRSG
jgi:hypothetical protein